MKLRKTKQSNKIIISLYSFWNQTWGIGIFDLQLELWDSITAFYSLEELTSPVAIDILNDAIYCAKDNTIYICPFNKSDSKFYISKQINLDIPVGRYTPKLAIDSRRALVYFAPSTGEDLYIFDNALVEKQRITAGAVARELLISQEQKDNSYRIGSISKDTKGDIIALVTNIESGKTTLSNLTSKSSITDGISPQLPYFAGKNTVYYFDDTKDNKLKLKLHNMQADKIDREDKDFTLPALFPWWSKSCYEINAISAHNNILYCSAQHFEKIQPRQVPPHLLLFDSDKQSFIRRLFFPRTAHQFTGVGNFTQVPHHWQQHLPPNNKFFHTYSSNSPHGNNNLNPAGPQVGSIHLENVRLSYYSSKTFLGKSSPHAAARFWALKDITIHIKPGERVGILGKNGSGKSTLARVVSQSLIPDWGFVEITGKSDLLSLGTGFKPNLTGRDNIYINGIYLGLSWSYIKEHEQEIIEFSELGEFIDKPVRTYSSGMKSRLTFSIAMTIQPDILILDEVMTTGDISFRQKARGKIRSMMRSSSTLLVISHQPDIITTLCTRAIWLHQGRIVMDDKGKLVSREYTKFFSSPNRPIEPPLYSYSL